MTGNPPLAKLTEPTIEEPENILDDILHIPDYLNASKWLETVLTTFHLDNPFKIVAAEFTGNWEKVQQAGGAIKNVAAYNRVYAQNLISEISRLTQSGLVTPQGGGSRSGTPPGAVPWVGHSATAASEYFRVFARRLEDQAIAMDKVGDHILGLAREVYRYAHLIEGSLQTAFDAIVDLGLAAVAAIESLGTGTPVIVAAYLIKRAKDAIGGVLNLAAAVQQAVDSILALIDSVAAEQDFELVPPARSHYDHEGIKDEIDAVR
ncbi:MAG: hypothetical protein ACRDUS_18125 [Mycobacterium sp.]